jgi:hypothetical protein
LAGTLEAVFHEWKSAPTPEQEDYISNILPIPDTPSESEMTSAIHHQYIHHFNENGIDEFYILNQDAYYASGFINVALLRTCKQARTEGSMVLYGNNCFAFDTLAVHSPQPFQDDRIPGIPFKRRYSTIKRTHLEGY